MRNVKGVWAEQPVMTKERARELIEKTFRSSFDKLHFGQFIQDLLNEVESKPFAYKGSRIKEAYRKYISSMNRIGKYQTPDGEEIDILVVKLKKGTSLVRARSMQKNYIADYLNSGRNHRKDAALVAFVAPGEEDWRFSLIKMDYTYQGTSSGKASVKEILPPSNRFSFLVGKHESSHTAQSRFTDMLMSARNPSLAELEQAFSVEPVNQEFFRQYQKLFIRTTEEMNRILKRNARISQDFATKKIDTVNFTKKLLGQIVFLFFLQKKGWFGVALDQPWGSGPKDYLRTLFNENCRQEKAKKEKNFFNDILEPLFYEALRRPRDDSYYSRFDCKIPFLNGGLFDPIGDYDWVNIDILLPNALFSNTKGERGDGILDVFDLYNFTVKEDEPLDREVAIDPELLGKTYEKFNAITSKNFEEYKQAIGSGKKNDENKFNRAQGVYYTPRSVVHFICQQSLIACLNRRLREELTEEDITALIEHGPSEVENEIQVETMARQTQTYAYKLPLSIKQHARLLDETLKDLAVCDPAIGSGAFPMGMMDEIIKARQTLAAYLSSKDAISTSYEFKRHCIEHCIYGVDLDPGAVEIAKLRLWLSLVVDEENIEDIKPLPNLDYKIMQGDSLGGVTRDILNGNLFDQLEEAKDRFINETDPDKKKHAKAEIDALVQKISKGESMFDFSIYFSEIMRRKAYPGFDLVVGNPPYGNLLEGSVKPEMKKKFLYKSSLNEISFPFVERGINLLKDGGTISYIITMGLTYRKDGSMTRCLLQRSFDTIRLWSFDRDPISIFDSMTQRVSIFIAKDRRPDVDGDFYTSNFAYTTADIVRDLKQNIQTRPLQKINDYLLTYDGQSKFCDHHFLPKIGDRLGIQILRKIRQLPCEIRNYLNDSKNTVPLIIRTSGGYYYNAFFKIPYKSVEFKEISCPSVLIRDYLCVLINSSLLYFWMRIYGDSRHFSPDMLRLFRGPEEQVLSQYTEDLKRHAEMILESLASVFDPRKKKFETSRIKNKIDELDDLLAKVYGLSDTELSYIKNYDAVIRNKAQADMKAKAAS